MKKTDNAGVVEMTPSGLGETSYEDRRKEFEKAIDPELMEYLRNFAFKMTRNRADAADLLQDTLYKALSSWDSYEEASKLRAWLSRIMKNTHNNELDRANTRNRFEQNPSEEWSPLRVVEDKAFQRMCQIQVLDQIRKALKPLCEEFQRTIVLRYFHDLKLEEIAAKEGCSVGTVKSRLSRAIKGLQKELGGSYKDLLSA